MTWRYKSKQTFIYIKIIKINMSIEQFNKKWFKTVNGLNPGVSVVCVV